MRYWFLLLIVLISCTARDEVFEPALDRVVFKEALKQSLVIEARANKERIELKMDSIPMDRYYGAMFDELSITREDFRATYLAYSEHPDEFELVFEEVAEELKITVDSLERMLNN